MIVLKRTQASGSLLGKAVGVLGALCLKGGSPYVPVIGRGKYISSVTDSWGFASPTSIPFSKMVMSSRH